MYIKKAKLKAILRSLSNGTTIFAACKAADLEPVTLWRWRKKLPKLDERIKQIIDSRIQIVEDALFKSAMDGNTTSMIFFLTNRASDRWADKRALVNNMIINKVGNNGSFTGENKALAEALRRKLFNE